MGRIRINIPDALAEQLSDLASRCNASQSQLGTLAIKQFLINNREALPLLPPARLDKTPCPPWRGDTWGGL